MRERAARYSTYCTVEATVKFLSEKMEKPLGRSQILKAATVHWLVLLASNYTEIYHRLDTIG